MVRPFSVFPHCNKKIEKKHSKSIIPIYQIEIEVLEIIGKKILKLIELLLESYVELNPINSEARTYTLEGSVGPLTGGDKVDNKNLKDLNQFSRARK